MKSTPPLRLVSISSNMRFMKSDLSVSKYMRKSSISISPSWSMSISMKMSYSAFTQSRSRFIVRKMRSHERFGG